MKLEIDLEEVIGGEGALAELVSEHIREIVQAGVGKKIDIALGVAIREAIEQGIKEKMPSLLDDVLNTEYVKVDRYGDRATGATTFRREVVAAITEELKYKKTNYRSDQNAFTSAIDGVVEKEVGKFKEEFNKKVDENFVKEALEYATNKLRERLGVKP